MKQIVMTGPRTSEIRQVDIPKITEDQVLVKVKYTGMCHSEFYPWTVAEPGQIFGHETMGYVAEVGRNVKGFSVGDRVTGLGGGGYKEYIVMEPDKMMHIPNNIKDEDAIVEPLGCLMSVGSRMMPNLLGDSIAVVGTGYMGLGMISMFKAMGYSEIVGIDLREEARENALKFGATKVLHPDELEPEFYLDWKNWESPDLTRDGHKSDIFHLGFPNVMEFAGTPEALNLAGGLACAHGRVGIGGFHNDTLRTVDFKLWNMKALEMINCHERRIMFETELCHRALDLISKGIWKFTGLTNHIYTMEEFDKAQYDMENHTNNFIKGAVKCDE
ncbi:MAG: hypothetical protein E7403_01145 [Ruminococcaceae bacterium]|nr:hypothetical protein [Oscillospiraceae bacterium]